ncbi:MAG: tripartite tricarboxylate transporter substrate binding protein [Xanthobacteraceae bacterium]
MRAIPIRLLALVAALATMTPAPLHDAAAQDFPSRPVRFIVPYAAGGSGDLLARLLGNKLAGIWGQQVVVDNRAGGGGQIGTEAAAHSEPDGYTLYLATDGPLTIAASLYKRVPYDWKRDFAPVSMLAMGYQVLIVRASFPARDLQEFIALARQKPGELNYASIGIGTAPHLGAELFKSVAKVDITHVPYRGSSAQAITALIAGDVAMFLVGTSTAVPHIKGGALRGLAVTSSKRVDGLPDVPTFAEAGLPGVDVSLWFAVLVPSGTPAAIVDKLHADIARVVADPEFKQALAVRGFEAISSSPRQLADFLDKDYVKFHDLIGRLGLQVD